MDPLIQTEQSSEQAERHLAKLRALLPGFDLNVSKISSTSDYYSIDCSKKSLNITASDLPTLLYACEKAKHLLLTRKLKNHKVIAESTWRVLVLTQEVSESLFDPLFERMAPLGFNAILLSNHETKLMEAARRWGFKVILKFPLSLSFKEVIPFEPAYPQMFEEAVAKFLNERFCYDALYWESPYFSGDFRQKLLNYHKLPLELFLEELAQLEKAFPKNPLFYAFPKLASGSLPISQKQFRNLQTNLSPLQCSILPALNGALTRFDLPAHPFIREQFDKCGVTLQGFRLDQEEWPYILTPELPQLMPAAFVEIAHIPKNGSFGEINLTLLGDFLWGPKRAFSFMDQALSIYRKDLDNILDRERIRIIASQVSRLCFLDAVAHQEATCSTEEVRVQIDALLIELKIIEKTLEAEKKSHKSEMDIQRFQEFQNFIDDAKGIVRLTLKAANLATPFSLSF